MRADLISNCRLWLRRAKTCRRIPDLSTVVPDLSTVVPFFSTSYGMAIPVGPEDEVHRHMGAQTQGQRVIRVGTYGDIVSA